MVSFDPDFPLHSEVNFKVKSKKYFTYKDILHFTMALSIKRHVPYNVRSTINSKTNIENVINNKYEQDNTVRGKTNITFTGQRLHVIDYEERSINPLKDISID